MVSSSLSLLPANETYQLWGIVRGQPVSLGLLGNQPRAVPFTVSDAHV